MKLVRVEVSGEIYYGSLVDEHINPITSSIFDDTIRVDSSISHHLKDVNILPPVCPSKIIATAINYQGATGLSPGITEPLVFNKSINTIIQF